MTEIISADKHASARAAEIIGTGGIIGFPTETVYGLGADALNTKSLRALYALKERRLKQPTLILISSGEDLSRFAASIPRAAEILINNFWPGPLTIVFKAAPSVPDILTGVTGSIGIRLPDSKLCMDIIEQAGVPVAAPSANPRGKLPARTAREVMDYFSGRLELIIDGGKSPGTIPSTVVDVTADPPAVLREGIIKTADILSALP